MRRDVLMRTIDEQRKARERKLWCVCEGCGVKRPDARPAPRWSDEMWCDDCNGNRERE